jgi:asparagine synthase (glutamine-hydrolysing)
LLRHGIVPLLPEQAQQALPSGYVRLRRVGQSHQLAYLYDAYQMLAIEMAERLYAHVGLEMRQPFGSTRMVEFALATPKSSRWRRNEDKWLHRRAMHGLRPDDVLRRSSKAEFSVTFSRCWTNLGAHMTGTFLARRRD